MKRAVIRSLSPVRSLSPGRSLSPTRNANATTTSLAQISTLEAPRGRSRQPVIPYITSKFYGEPKEEVKADPDPPTSTPYITSGFEGRKTVPFVATKLPKVVGLPETQAKKKTRRRPHRRLRMDELFDAKRILRALTLSRGKPRKRRLASRIGKGRLEVGKPLKAREGNTLELKETLNIGTFLTSAGKYISAFLNTEGGSLVYGVSDKGVVKGVQLTRSQMDNLTLTLDVLMKDHISPFDGLSVMPCIMFHDVHGGKKEGLKVVEVAVPKGGRPFYEFQGKAYVRYNASTRLMEFAEKADRLIWSFPK